MATEYARVLRAHTRDCGKPLLFDIHSLGGALSCQRLQLFLYMVASLIYDMRSVQEADKKREDLPHVIYSRSALAGASTRLGCAWSKAMRICESLSYQEHGFSRMPCLDWVCFRVPSLGPLEAVGMMGWWQRSGPRSCG